MKRSRQDREWKRWSTGRKTVDRDYREEHGMVEREREREMRGKR
jgi:hypothetical protein